MIESIFRKFPLLRKVYVYGLRKGFEKFQKKSGIRVMEKGWKNLIILDACRYDHFSEHVEIPGRLRKAISLGTHTPEWMKENFAGDYPDTVCVAGNPYYSEPKLESMLGKNPFFHVEHVWDYGWDENLETVPPSKVTDAAMKIRDKYPNKRMVIHYMQPHAPFLSKPELVRNTSPMIEGFQSDGSIKAKFLRQLGTVFPDLQGLWKHDQNVWNLIKKEEYGMDEFRELHIDNLRKVLEETKRLLNHLSGKTIITSGHGELFGEFWMYGHPYGIRVKPLIEVPWFEASLVGD